MAKTAAKVNKKDTLKKASPQERADQESSSRKSKAAQAIEYLNKFHPGWDFYLKAKDN